MNKWFWEGTVQARSSLSHGGEALGVTQYLRREKVYLPTGVVEDIPIISGNSLRGLLRRSVADVWWESVGSPRLSPPVAHAIWSGGSLAKSTGEALTGERLREVKRICPVIEIFGTAGGGRIIQGTLKVGKLVPLCVETQHIVPAGFHNEINPNISFWDLTQIEEYSKNPSLDKAEEPFEDSGITPMRYGVETYLAGTYFYTWMSIGWVSDPGYQLFMDGLRNYLHAPVLGGLSGKGHGALEFPPHVVDTTVPSWEPPSEVQEEKTLRETLSWLD